MFRSISLIMYVFILGHVNDVYIAYLHVKVYKTVRYDMRICIYVSMCIYVKL